MGRTWALEVLCRDCGQMNSATVDTRKVRGKNKSEGPQRGGRLSRSSREAGAEREPEGTSAAVGKTLDSKTGEKPLMGSEQWSDMV